MAKLVQWSVPVYEEFRKIACLTEDEEDVLRTHVLFHWTRAKQSTALSMSMSKVDKTYRSLKDKYMAASQFSDVLKDAIIK